MSLLNCKLSLVHHIKACILPQFGYVEDMVDETPSVQDAVAHTYRLQYGDIAYADPSGHLNPSGIIVTDSGRRMELTEYSVDCVNGILNLNAAPSGTLLCSYRRYTVGVRDAFPDAIEFDTISLPFVCIDFSEQDTRSFAIGQEASFYDMVYFMDIFATSDAMRLQLTDRIQKGMKTWVAVVDFESAMPLNYDGTMNMSFDMDGQFQYWLKMRSNPRSKMINIGSTSVRDKYRSVVDGYLTTIK